MAIRVYVVEDHPVMRETLVAYFDVSRDYELCGVAETAEQALREIPAASPSLILLDLSLPDRNGLDILPTIQSISATPCIVLSGYREPTYAERAIAAGAHGYVLKGSPRELRMAIQTVLGGGVYVSEAVDCFRNQESGVRNREMI